MESYWSPHSMLAGHRPEPHPRQLRFENQRVKMLLDALGLAQHIPAMVKAYADGWGQRRLTFETFHEFFPNFPVMMEVQSFFATTPVNEWARLSKFMTQFDKTFVCKRYEMLLKRYEGLSNPDSVHFQAVVPPVSRNLPLGMVFPWDGIKGGLIMHNGAPLTGGSKFVHECIEENFGPVQLVIERYAPWVAVIGKCGWTPDSPPPAPRQRPKPEVKQNVTTPSWLTRLCGPRDAMVLSWLMRVLGTKASRSQQMRFRHRRNGALLVAVTCRRLAEEIGFSDDQQVGRALDSLNEQGFIALPKPQKGETRKTYIQVNRPAICEAKRQLQQKPSDG